MVSGYRPGDRNACLALFDGNLPRYFTAQERDEFAAFLDAPPVVYLVVRVDAHLLACGGYGLHPREEGTWVLCWGMVAQQHHRQGLGRDLVNARLRRIAAEPGAQAVQIDTSQHTAPFYARFGFTKRECEADGFGPGLERVRMRLDGAAWQPYRLMALPLD